MGAMNVWEFFDFCKGKTGSVYVARRGTVTVIEIEGETYLTNNLAGFGVIKNPADAYWTRSIDWAGGFSDYFALGMAPAENPRIRAEPILEITEEQKIRLREIAEKLKRQKAAALA
jgi:hypothetical protein